MIAPYLDSSAIIYLIEGRAAAQSLVAQRIAAAEGDPAGRVLTSHLARLECRVKPLRVGDASLLATYDAFFTRARLSVVDVSAAAIDRATELRARYGSRRRTRYTSRARSSRAQTPSSRVTRASRGAPRSRSRSWRPRRDGDEDSMIHDNAEYQVAVRRRQEQRERLAQDEVRLKKAGLSAEELRRALDPLRSFHLQLEEEIDSYERRAGGGPDR